MLGAHARHQEPRRRPGRASSRRSCSPCPACSRRSTTAPSRRPHADGKGKIFDAAADTADRLQPGAGPPAAPASACRLKHAVFDKLVYGKLRAALGGQAQHAVSGGAAARRAARPLLPRHRHHGPRGLRPDRDHAPPPPSTRRDAQQDRHGRPAAARRHDPHRRRRRGAGQGRARLRRLLEQRRRPPPRRSTRRLVPHRRPRRRSTTTATCASPAARRRSSSPPAARTSPRP